MEVTVENGKVVGLTGDIDHPESHGDLCPKGRAAIDILYSPDRLTKPLKRVGRRGGGDWQSISWGEALELVAQGLANAKENHGPESVWFHKGSGHDLCGGDVRPYLHRPANAFGTPNISCPFYICNGPRTLNMFLMAGAVPAPDEECQRASN
jgi:anaerobic selenocysteine-containing dehydrogenase